MTACPKLELPSVQELVSRLPSLPQPLWYQRERLRLQDIALGLICVGGFGMLAAKLASPAREALGWVGLAMILVGGAIYLVLMVILFIELGGRAWRIREKLHHRLDQMRVAELSLIADLRKYDRAELSSFARWLKLQAQIFDRTTARSAVVSATATAIATLIGSRYLGGPESEFHEWAKYTAIGIAAGGGLAAILHHSMAEKFLRLEHVVLAAAEPATAEASHKSGPH